MEIKGSLFKKVDINHLYQISCSDAKERFHYVLMLSIVCIRNMTEVAWKIGMHQRDSTICLNAVHSLYTELDRGRLENWYVSERFHYVLMLSIVCIRNMTEVAWKIGMHQRDSTICLNAVHSLYTELDRGRLENWYVSERFHYVLMLSIVCIWNMTEVAWKIGMYQRGSTMC